MKHKPDLRKAVWGHGPRCNRPLPDHACWRDGKQSGARTWAESRPDGVDWAVLLNTFEFPDSIFINTLIGGGMSAFLDTDPTIL
jgi:hypothetical protein